LGGGRSSFGGGLGGFGGNSFGGGTNRTGGNQSQSKNTLRTTMKPIVVVQSVPAAQRTTEIQSRMSRLRLPERYRDVQVTVEGRKAILTGVADSADDVKFIARLLSLEPGIDSVESRLTARASTSEPVQASPTR
jgi:osmotically-inducible protein OsmY